MGVECTAVSLATALPGKPASCISQWQMVRGERIECYYCHVILCCFWMVNSNGKVGRLSLGFQKDSEQWWSWCGQLSDVVEANLIKCVSGKIMHCSRMTARHNSATKTSEGFWSPAGMFVLSIWAWNWNERVMHFSEQSSTFKSRYL